MTFSTIGKNVDLPWCFALDLEYRQKLFSLSTAIKVDFLYLTFFVSNGEIEIIEVISVI